MIFPDDVIEGLATNATVFKALLEKVPSRLQHYKEDAKRWSLLEIVCHLVDEEVEDFRTRIKHTLETPNLTFKSIRPKEWPLERKYAQQDYNEVVGRFLKERQRSLAWLQGLKTTNWNDAIFHTNLGELSARDFLENWLAHDYLHIRQINQIKRSYLASFSNHGLGYAGKW